MDYRIYFSNDFLALNINYFEMKLQEAFRYSLVTRGDKSKICVYDCHTYKRLHEYSLESQLGKAAYDDMVRIEKIENLLSDYKALWRYRNNYPVPKINSDVINTLMRFNSNRLNIDFYNSLSSDMAKGLSEKFNRSYYSGNTGMASYLENRCASVLKKLNLEYKYEPLISLKNYDKLVDFFIGVPIINFCFPLEVAGKLDDVTYFNKFQQDMERYYRSDLVEGHTLLVIRVNSRFKVSDEMMAQEICHFINKAVRLTLLEFDSKLVSLINPDFDLSDYSGISE